MERVLFAFSKILGLLIRPVIIYLLLRYNHKDLATDFALIVTSVASSFVILNNQNFREIYQYFIVSNRSKGGRGLGGRYLLQEYIEGTIIHIVVFLPVAGIFLFFWTERLDLFLSSMVLMITEKYFDEDQRILVYKKKYYEWIANFSARVILPTLLFIIFIVTFDIDSVYIYPIVSVVFLLVYIGIFRRQYVRVFTVCIVCFRKSGIWLSILRYWQKYQKEYFMAQVWIVITANVMYVDRFLVSNAWPDKYAEYLLIVNLANIIATFHNMGYVSFMKPKLIVLEVDVYRAQYSARNLIIPLLLSILVLFGYLVLNLFSLSIVTFDYEVVFMLVMLYYIHAISFVPKELAFWRIRREHLVVIDGLVVVVPVVSCYYLSTQILSIVISVFVAVLLRFVVFSFYFRHLEKLNAIR
ncbi:hypothetical protein [Granulosicoccus antarcticus]|nr:hypothetical protein [Granulosicoccus antarcticus]